MATRMRKALKRHAERFYYLYHWIRNTWPLWWYVHNRRARKFWGHRRVALDGGPASVVAALRANGIATMPFADIFGSDAFATLQEYVAARLADPRVQDDLGAARASLATGGIGRNKKQQGKYVKDFLVNLWESEANPATFYNENLFLRFLLDERILSIVASYLGVAPRLSSFTLLSTVPVPPDAPAYLSQRWHRDPEDKKMMKVFLYMTDVDEQGAGPFIYVRQSQLGGKWRRLFPQRLPAGRYPGEGEVERAVPPEDIQINLAPAGSLIFCDTSGLHKGGLSTIKNRIMFTGGFTSDASVYPISFVRPTAEALAGYGDLARFAVMP